jgi:6-phosphogluconolactonase/glucosamine-6-phosphate isomerase/deaminase
VVLCLPTGSTPIPTYKELVRMNKEEGLSFKNVITFNLDEYANFFLMLTMNKICWSRTHTSRKLQLFHETSFI